MPRPRRAVALLALVLTAAVGLGACDAGSSSDVGSAASPTAPDASDSPSGSSTPAASPAASQALCSALVNAVATSTPWQLGEPLPGSRSVGGVSVPSCTMAGADGEPQGELMVAYLPAAGNLGGTALLAGVCRAVVGAQRPAADARSCAAPTLPPAEPGAELQRADLTTEDVGVLVLSFSSDEPSYRKTSVDDLAAVGGALADDRLLAMATG